MKRIIIALFSFSIILAGCQDNSTINNGNIKNNLLTDFSEDIDYNDFELVSAVEVDETDDTYYLNSYLDVEEEILYSNAKFNHTFKYDSNELFINFYTNTFSSNDLSNVYVDSVMINGKSVDWTLNGDTLENLHVEFEENYLKGDSITIELEYAFMYLSDKRKIHQDPRMASHNGRSTDFVTMFYYPIVAMRNDKGWQTDPHSDTGEVYYNDVRDYQVSITAPTEYVLSHSGVETSTELLGENTKHNIYLRDGRDFSFSASKDYFTYVKDVNGVKVSIVSLHNLDDKKDTLFQLVEDMFEFNERNIGPYIYDSLSLEYGHIFGMESTAATYCSYPNQYITTVHEIYHQWFYSMIGSNQGDEPWLDEGLTSFMTGAFFFDYPEYNEPQDYFDGYDVSNDEVQPRVKHLYGGSVFEGMDTYMEMQLSYPRAYGFYAYWYPTTVFKFYLDTYLDGNPEPYYEVFRAYYNEFVNDIATTDDFFRIMEDKMGADAVDWFKEALGNARQMKKENE